MTSRKRTPPANLAIMNVCSETYAYGDHPSQTLTIHYQPAPCDTPAPGGGPAQRPGLLMVHGGYWEERSSLRDWPQRFAADGYVVIEPTYRLVGEDQWPAQLEDLHWALGWARTHAACFHLDPGRIAGFGSSAGGHLVAHLGTRGGTPPPAATATTDPAHAGGHTARLRVDHTAEPTPGGRELLAGYVALSPPLNPYRAWRDGAARRGKWATNRKQLRAAAQRLAGCTPHEGWDTTPPTGPPTGDPTGGQAPAGERTAVEEEPPGEGNPGQPVSPCQIMWQDLAVKNHASGKDDAPALLIHHADDLVPLTHSSDLRTTQLAAGMPPTDITVLSAPGAGHGMTLMTSPGIAQAIRAFLAACTATPTPYPHPAHARP